MQKECGDAPHAKLSGDEHAKLFGDRRAGLFGDVLFENEQHDMLGKLTSVKLICHANCARRKSHIWSDLNLQLVTCTNKRKSAQGFVQLCCTALHCKRIPHVPAHSRANSCPTPRCAASTSHNLQCTLLQPTPSRCNSNGCTKQGKTKLYLTCHHVTPQQQTKSDLTCTHVTLRQQLKSDLTCSRHAAPVTQI